MYDFHLWIFSPLKYHPRIILNDLFNYYLLFSQIYDFARRVFFLKYYPLTCKYLFKLSFKYFFNYYVLFSRMYDCNLRFWVFFLILPLTRFEICLWGASIIWVPTHERLP